MNKCHSFIEGKIGKFLFLKVKVYKFYNFSNDFFFFKKLIKQERIDFIKANDPHYNSLLALLL